MKIKINDSSHQPTKQEKEDIAGPGKSEDKPEKISHLDKNEGKSEKNSHLDKNEDKSTSKPEKIETCYFCLQKFDMNKDDLSHYKYGKFPMCDYCSQFYGFYD